MFQQRVQYFPSRKGLKQQAAQKSLMIHQVIKGARDLHRESYALLKRSEIVASCMFGKFCSLSVQVLFYTAISKARIEIKTAVVEGASRNEATCKIPWAVLNGLENKLISTTRST